MEVEKIYKQTDGTRIKVKASLHLDWDKAWITFFTNYCEKGKRKFSLTNDDSLLSLIMEKEQRAALIAKIGTRK